MRPAEILTTILLGCSFYATRADFGQAILNEAVDLFAAQDESDDPRSMEDLLHWAISHSDPAKLAAQAEEAQRIQMVRDLKEQRRRVKELLDHVRSQTTETDMIKEGIEILRRVDASDTELVAALRALQMLVEPIDNANDLQPLGGIAPVVAQLTRGSVVAAAAAHVIGTAASNNPTFQRHLLAAHPEVVATLLQVSREPHEDSAVKGMYALAALVRNLREARAAFLEAGGFKVLDMLLRGQRVAARVKRRALSLFMDLVDTQPAGTHESAAPGAAAASGAQDAAGGPAATFRTISLNADGGATASVLGGPEQTNEPPQGAADGGLAAAAVGSGLPEAVVSLLLEDDADMQEKALLVVQRLATDSASRQVLQSKGAGDAIAHLRQRLLAEAPKPGDEPDPYHEYLSELAQQVATLMNQPSEPHAAGGPSSTTPDASTGQAAQRGQEPPGRAGSRARQEQVGEGQGEEVLALGGPSRASGARSKEGVASVGAERGRGGAGGGKGGHCGGSETQHCEL